MKTLTLDQVKQAGRFAWREDDLLIYTGSRFIELSVAINGGQTPPDEGHVTIWLVHCCEWRAYPSPAIDDRGHWYHEDGCDCEFCQPPRQSKTQ
jgi:hypothetical protein